MAFNKREYKAYKKYMDAQLKHGFYLSPEVYTSLKSKSPLETSCNIALQVLGDMVHAENFEASQAIVDSLRDVFKNIGHPIPDEALLNIKSPNLELIHCHISYVRCKLSGL
jgi:hypothetical protein